MEKRPLKDFHGWVMCDRCWNGHHGHAMDSGRDFDHDGLQVCECPCPEEEEE